MAEAADWLVGDGFVHAEFAIGDHLGDHRGLDCAWADRVDVVGEITTTYNRMDLAADPGLAITIYTAEPGSKSAEALSLLGSWAATIEPPDLQAAPDHP